MPLLLRSVTPANFGDSGGSATVDRPVALDAWDRLPYLPASALKGVLAGRFGNLGLPATAVDARRGKLFGTPDVTDAAGKAGTLVFGDGELLCFPLRLASGQVVAVLIARTLFRLERWGVLTLPGLRQIQSLEAYEGELAASELPAPARWEDFGIGAPAREALAASLGATASPVLVAAPELAEQLWQRAVEERTQTALGEGRVVAAGSLRTVELIPPGTVFLSMVSNLGTEPADLGPATPLQVGAWEAVGCGFLHPEVWAAPPAEELEIDPENPAPRPDRATARRPDYQVMARAFRAVEALREVSKVAAKARSAVYDLGPRLRIRGLEQTLAFCLAKAGGEDKAVGRRGAERDAYRWLLAELFAAEEGEAFSTVRPRVVAAISGSASPPAELETTWLWLRRYCESLLEPEEADAGEEAP
jgi:hypothetical protein